MVSLLVKLVNIFANKLTPLYNYIVSTLLILSLQISNNRVQHLISFLFFEY